MIVTGTRTNWDGSYGHIEAEGNTYDEAREDPYALLEEGQHLIAVRAGPSSEVAPFRSLTLKGAVGSF